MNDIVKFYLCTKRRYFGFFLRYALYFLLIAALWVLKVTCDSSSENGQGFIMESFGKIIGISLYFFIFSVTILFGIIASRFFEGYIRYLFVIYILGKSYRDLYKDIVKSNLLISIPPYLLVLAAFLLAGENRWIGWSQNKSLFFLLGMSASYIVSAVVTIFLCVITMKGLKKV